MEKKYISTFLAFFEGVCEIISAFISELAISLRFFLLESRINEVFLSNSAIFYSRKYDKNPKKSFYYFNKELNTATVYINHNLVYTASACRLHPGPTLYMEKAFWRTKRTGN
ncbi:MAG: hypothetical protein WC615_09020 [Mucilaginibacter sp.]|jgi:hypothetical protein|uniref:hypothetical protein n=1 Tax=Mucilaginibacter sp. TaxID=1882438 RepID=UPI0035691100